MIKNPLSALHPSFDALSAYADLSDVDRAASRLTRHVHECPECQATIRAIHDMGAGARSLPPADLPHGLWARIESEAASPSKRAETEELASPIWSAAPALKPTSTWPVSRGRLTKRWGLALIAAAAAVIAIFAWPVNQGLEAAGTVRLTFSPSRPVPGGLVKVRYTAASWLRGQPRLVLVGRAISEVAMYGYYRSSLGDSIATLRPSAGGVYEAEFRLPDTAPAMWLGVSDSLGDETDVDGWRPWIMIGGTRDGKPSLSALLAATNIPSYYGAEQYGSRQRLDVADSLRRYFPTMPAGWAYARPREGRGTLFERLVSFFDSSERKYMSFYNELWPQKKLDAERLHEMVTYAHTIDEPDEVNRWARRLALEHPEDPRALIDLASALHALELKEPPAIRDSMRPWLPVFERLNLAAARNYDHYEFLRLVSRYADTATVARWEARIDSLDGEFLWVRDWQTNPMRRKLAEAAWLKAAQKSCALPTGRFPLSQRNDDWVSSCNQERVLTFTGLARAKLMDNDPRAAIAFADSAERIPLSGAPCGRFYGAGLVLVEGNLRLGDTARAEQAAITRMGAWSTGPLRDSTMRWFGARARSPKFLAAVDSSRRSYAACAEREKAAREAMMQRYRSAN